MTGTVTVFNDPKPANSTLRYACITKKEDGAAIGGNLLTTLTLSLYDADTGQAVNSLSGVNILNTGRGTIDNSGNLVVILTPADMVATGSPDPGTIQYRSMVIDWTYNAGNSKGRHQVDFPIQALAEP